MVRRFGTHHWRLFCVDNILGENTTPEIQAWCFTLRQATEGHVDRGEKLRLHFMTNFISGRKTLKPASSVYSFVFHPAFQAMELELGRVIPVTCSVKKMTDISFKKMSEFSFKLWCSNFPADQWSGNILAFDLPSRKRANTVCLTSVSMKRKYEKINHSQ
jgi:hypothetical protein